MSRSFVVLLWMCILSAVTAPSVFSQQGGTAPSPPPFAQIADPASAATPWWEVPSYPADVVVSVSFVRAELADVLQFLNIASGVPIVMDAEVKGTVTISSVRQVPLSVAYDAINAALRVRGYTMVGTLQDDIIRVVPLRQAIAERATVQMGSNIDQIGTGDTMITQIVPIRYISATKLKDELQPLVASGQANLLVVSSTNMLIITDTEANVRRMVQIINLLDTDNSDILDVTVYQCRYASASALIDTLEKAFGIGKYAVGATPTGQPPGRGGGGGNNANNQPTTIRTDDGLMSLKGAINIAADERMNALIISAEKQKVKTILDLVKQLDVDTTSEVRARVFPLRYADAAMVASQLNTLFEQPQGGVNNRPRFGAAQPPPSATDYAGLRRNIIVADMRTNAVVVTATEQNLKEYELLIRELDAPSALSDIARTFSLKYAKASTLATTLNALFRGSNRAGMNVRDLFYGSTTGGGDPITALRNITVVADDKTNTLLITGTPQSFPMIDSLIAQLDRRTTQVFIQVAIVDVTLDEGTKFGVEWTWKNGMAPDTRSPRDSFGHDFGLADEKYGLRYSIISDNLQVLLHALATRSNVKVYSTPSITTADNVAARISIGQDIPFVSSSEGTNSGNFRQTVDFKNVSITLNVTPHVTDTSNLITLDVQQTINELIGREIALNAPIIANREARTTVMVNDGQTIVIGGIIKENNEDILKEVPVLSKIPLIGELFKSRSTEQRKSELMVFLTPHILRDEESVQAITAQERDKLTHDPLPNGPAWNGGAL